MIARSWQWLNRAYPHEMLLSAWIALAAVYACEWLFMGVLWLVYGAVPDEWRHLLGYRLGIVALLAGLAAWRAHFINPARREAYLKWLEATPWTPGKPLPLGSVDVTLQDIVLMAAAMGLWRMWPTAWFVPLAFLLPYCAVLTRLNFRAGQDGAVLAALALTALLPLSFFKRDWPWLPLALTSLIAIVTRRGWRRTLQEYPWQHLPRWDGVEQRCRQPGGPKAISLWWPRVHPWPKLGLTPIVSWREAAMAATLLGWYAGVATFTTEVLINQIGDVENARIGELPANVANAATVGIGLMVAAVRLLRYGYWCVPPISLLGRSKTGRWIIPGYDRVFVAPLVAVAVTFVLPIELRALGCPLSATAFLTVALAVAAAMGIGPTLAEWSLTGEYRMVGHHPMQGSTRARRGAGSAT